MQIRPLLLQQNKFLWDMKNILFRVVRQEPFFPIVTAERSNSIVSVHVKRYTGYVSTYIVDSNGVTVSTSMGYAMDGQYDANCVMDNIAHDSYTIHVVLDDCSYIGYFEM